MKVRAVWQAAVVVKTLDSSSASRDLNSGATNSFSEPEALAIL